MTKNVFFNPFLLWLSLELFSLTLTVLLIPAMNKDQWDPEFLKAIPIMKTRSGMQVRNNIRGSVCNKSVAMMISVHAAYAEKYTKTFT